MRKLLSRLVGLFLVLVLGAACSDRQQNNSETADRIHADRIHADRILLNGNVYSLNWPQPKLDGQPAADAPYKNGRWHADASAIAIADGKIVFLGSDDEALKYQSAETEVIDLDGATALPGLIDSHVHVAELGEILSRINLIGIDSVEGVLSLLREQAKAVVDANQWVIGQGWDEGAWANNYPDKTMLDAIFPTNPVVLKSLHGFAVWANSAALDRAGISSADQAPVGGEIVTDAAGKPSGILLNRATKLLLDSVPAPSDEQFKQFVLLGLQRMAQDGFVAVHEAGAETRHMQAFQALAAENALPVRVYAMVSARDKSLAEEWAAVGPQIDPQGWLDIRSVKAYYDGALGSRGARLLDDYSDLAGHRGVSGDGYGFDGEVVRKLIKAGFQVGIHAIGDAGNRETLNYLEDTFAEDPDARSLRHRIEHAQILHPDDIDRFADLQLIASMEPPHAVEDKTWAEQRLGARRIKGAYAWRSLRQAGAKITFNSDLPGSDHDIFYGLHAAVTRRDKLLEPAEGWYPDETLSIEETLRAYTEWAAYSAFRESDTGILSVGRWADITVLDIDPFTMAEQDPGALLDGKVMMTVINGNVVYRAL